MFTIASLVVTKQPCGNIVNAWLQGTSWTNSGAFIPWTCFYHGSPVATKKWRRALSISDTSGELYGGMFTKHPLVGCLEGCLPNSGYQIVWNVNVVQGDAEMYVCVYTHVHTHTHIYTYNRVYRCAAIIEYIAVYMLLQLNCSVMSNSLWPHGL